MRGRAWKNKIKKYKIGVVIMQCWYCILEDKYVYECPKNWDCPCSSQCDDYKGE